MSRLLSTLKYINLPVASVSAADDGVRLDRLLARSSGVPDELVKRMIRQKRIRVLPPGEAPSSPSSVHATAAMRLPAGSTVVSDKEGQAALRPAPAAAAAPSPHEPESRALATVLARQVLFSSEDVVVLSKPAGVAAQGGTDVGASVSSALPFLAALLRPGLEGGGDAPSLRLVHRLDRDVSGVLVLARSRASAEELSAAFRAAGEEGEAAAAASAGTRIVRKQYVGLVAGALPAGTASSGMVTAPAVHVEAGSGGKGGSVRTSQAATTAYEVTHSTAALSVVLLWPSTGRKHQLRQHTASLFGGTGLLGDVKYGGAAAPSLPGIALHLGALALPASDGTGRVVLDPLPARMRDVLLARRVPASALERCGAIAPGPPEAARRI